MWCPRCAYVTCTMLLRLNRTHAHATCRGTELPDEAADTLVRQGSRRDAGSSHTIASDIRSTIGGDDRYPDARVGFSALPSTLHRIGLRPVPATRVLDQQYTSRLPARTRSTIRADICCISGSIVSRICRTQASPIARVSAEA